MKAGNSTSASIPDLADMFIQGIVAGESQFYSYGTTIVEPVTDPGSGTGRLRTITVPDLKWYVRRVFPDQFEGTISAVAEDILHNPELPLERIRGLVTTPTFRDDFSLITVPGYDLQSGLYYSPDPSWATFTFQTSASKTKATASLDLLLSLLTVPGYDLQSGLHYSPDPSLATCTFETNASKTKAKASLDLLLELLTDFPFRNESEKFSYIATLLTLSLRSSIRGVVPSLAIDGNGQSVGKGLLSTMLSLIAYGDDIATNSAPKSREEWASKLDSILLRGAPFAVIDNIVDSKPFPTD